MILQKEIVTIAAQKGVVKSTIDNDWALAFKFSIKMLRLLCFYFRKNFFNIYRELIFINWKTAIPLFSIECKILLFNRVIECKNV